jgi:sporulation protein YlmC with PRC-barrel domain
VAFKVVPSNIPVMSDVLAENLSGKSVMGSDGTELGMLYNITMNLKTGALNDLLVSPNEEFPASDSRFQEDDQGRLHVPVSRVQAVKDYIVIDR